MFGKKNGEVKTKMLKKSYECVQCHKVMCTVFIDEKDDDAYEESYPCCWPCFLKLCDEASANKTKKRKKTSAEKITKVNEDGKPIAGRYPWGEEDEKK